MHNYQKTQIVKLCLLLVAMVIVILSFWYSNRIVQEVSKEEKAKIEQIALTFKQINIVEDDAYRSFLIDIIRNNNSVPVILTDDKGNIKGHRNVLNINEEKYNNDEKYKLKSDDRLKKEYERIKSVRPPIEIVILEDFKDYIYYDDSFLLKQLRYYPYIQITVIGLFLLISYLSFSNARKAEQNKVWVGMAKETAHQLGTPISSLMGWMEYAKSIDNKSNFKEDIIPEIEKDIGRLEQVAERFSKIGSEAELKEQDLRPLIKNTIEYFKKRAPKHICIEMKDSPNYKAELNAPLFNWVIENLISNALNAIKVDKGNIWIELKEENNTICIEIHDNGIGIPKSQFKNVFKPGYTTRKRGWGLGLSLANRIIEAYHKGKIFVKSSVPNKGSCFRIELKKV